MESSLAKRDVKKVGKVWELISKQLQEWEEWSVSSLYGDATPTIEIGQLQKKFAKVCGSCASRNLC